MQDTNVKPWYKMTELGIIPEDWEVKELGDICNIKKWELITLETSVNWVIPVIAWWKQPAYYHNKANRKSNTITISASWANAWYVNFHNNPIFASDCSTIEESNSFSIFFIYNYLLLLQKKIFKSQTWWAQPHVHPTDLNPLKISLPKSISEQKQIAQVLSDTDELINSLDKLIEKKEKIKEWTMQELLTWKRRLPWFSWEWENVLLSSVSWFQEWPWVRTEQFTKTGVKLFNGSNIINWKINLSNTDRFISMKEANWIYSHFLAELDDIVIACSWVVYEKFYEKVSIIEKHHLPLCMNTSTMRFKIKDNRLYNIYLLYFLRTTKFKSQVFNQATWSAQLNFWPSHVNKVIINLPTIEEQKAIAEVLSDMDSEIEVLKKKRDKYNLIKEWMMQELLTWRIRFV